MQRIKFYLIPLFVLFFGFYACQSDVVKKGRNEPLEKEISHEFHTLSKSEIKMLQKQIAPYFNEFLNPEKFNGQFLVAKNGKIVYFKAQGYSNFKHKTHLTSETPMHVASVSKVFTAMAVLRLADQHQIDLDADIRTYIKDIPYEGVSVRMLLNHRSGIPYYGYFTFDTWNLGKSLTNKDIVRLLKKHKFPLNFPPNTKFAYCNTNYALLALIIEKVMGESFPEAMKSLIFEPVRMKHSFILSQKINRTTISQSYNSKHVLQEFDYLDAVYGDKNLYTTAYDIYLFDKATYSTDFLSDSLRKQLYCGYSYERPGKSNYGLGVRMKEEEGRSTYFFHTGWWHGNTACYATLREDTICIVALSNVYTKSVYSINRLAGKFGNYPFNFEE
jgi:CubicO group peptidase (beta-lactamase class C family)